MDNRLGGVISAPTTIDVGGCTIRNAGTLQVGGIRKVGATTLTGNLVQTSTGSIVVDVAAGSNTADHLQVNGTASLAGNVVPLIANPAKLKPGSKEVNILTATGGVTWSGPQGVVSNTPVVRYGLVAPDTNSLDLTYAGSQPLQVQGLGSANRAEVGRALDAILSNDPGALGPLAGDLAVLTSPQALAAALDSLSGEAVADVQQTVFAAQQIYADAVLRHVTNETRDTGPASYATASLVPAAGAPANPQGMRVWVGGFGGNNVLSGTSGQGSLHTQVAGALIGLDKWFDPDRMAGISVGGGSSDFSVAGRGGQSQTTSVDVAVHGLARFGQVYTAAIVSYGNFGSDVRRTALGGVTGLSTTGSVRSNVVGGRAELGWRHLIGTVTLTPFAALEVNHVWQNSLTESTVAGPGPGGGALALRFGAAEQTSVPLTVGGRAGSDFQIGGGHVLSLSAELGWMHEFNPQRSLTAAFVAAPNVPFQVLGVSASRDSAVTGLDGKLSLTQSVALLGSVTGRFSGVETAVGGFGGLQATW